MSFKLRCNIKSCCKELDNIAYTTTCSHIFCEKHGQEMKGREISYECPACKTNLHGNSILQVDLSRNTSYKSTLLLGAKPNTVLQIASEAINFWTQQCNQEKELLLSKTSIYREKLHQSKFIIEKNKRTYEENIKKEVLSKLEQANAKIKSLHLELQKKNLVNSSKRDLLYQMNDGGSTLDLFSPIRNPFFDK